MMLWFGVAGLGIAIASAEIVSLRPRGRPGVWWLVIAGVVDFAAGFCLAGLLL